jgi:hypothetical protein
MVRLVACGDCRGNLFFGLRDHFLASFDSLFNAFPQLSGLLAGEFISFSCFLRYIFPGFIPCAAERIQNQAPSANLCLDQKRGQVKVKSDHAEKRQDQSEKQEQPSSRRELSQNNPKQSPENLEWLLPGLLARSCALTDVLFKQFGAIKGAVSAIESL